MPESFVEMTDSAKWWIMLGGVTQMPAPTGFRHQMRLGPRVRLENNLYGQVKEMILAELR
jgi:hypothetical protein